MTHFKILDISGDVGLHIYGATDEELFHNAAQGLFSLITEPSHIVQTEERKVMVASEDDEGMLIKWLNELIFLFDAYGFVGKKFALSFKGQQLNAVIAGGIFDQSRDECRLLIKAATYHNLILKKDSSGYEARVMFDI